MSRSPIVQTIPLSMNWPTADPFLFGVHHLDHYPQANERLGPAASLGDRPLGNDFEARDGWRMYHGQTVPGFPAHPHRGFETITFVRRGLIDHADSLGAAARYGTGDVQWLTAGSGIVHSEMFPLLDRSGPNTVELFQIWLNLPAANKFADPHFSMMWADQIPRRIDAGDGQATAEITVIAGRLGDSVAPSPPPASWASNPAADVAIWHLVLSPGMRWELPPTTFADTVRTLYVFDGDRTATSAVTIAGEPVASGTGVVVDATASVTVEVAATATRSAEVLMLQGRPLAEPVARYGPFVMNTRAQIEQAFGDYQRTRFGGWPWDRDDPVHGTDETRFARQP